MKFFTCLFENKGNVSAHINVIINGEILVARSGLNPLRVYMTVYFTRSVHHRLSKLYEIATHSSGD